MSDRICVAGNVAQILLKYLMPFWLGHAFLLGVKLGSPPAPEPRLLRLDVPVDWNMSMIGHVLLPRKPVIE
jgi:hypothetical protein